MKKLNLIGIFDRSSKKWTGSRTPAKNFNLQDGGHRQGGSAGWDQECEVQKCSVDHEHG